MTGSTYNSWKVISYSHTVGKVVFWNCVCLDCGKEYVVKGQNVRIGLSKQCVTCGHKTTRKKQTGINKSKCAEKSAMKYLFSFFKKSAKRRKYEFTLNPTQLKSLVTSNCHYCGIEPNNECFPMKNNGLSKENTQTSIMRHGIDRVDNDRGYVPDNVVSCCTMCNKAKHAYTKEQFLDWIRRINNFNNLHV